MRTPEVRKEMCELITRIAPCIVVTWVHFVVISMGIKDPWCVDENRPYGS